MTDRQARMITTALLVVAGAIGATEHPIGGVLACVAALFCVGDYYNTVRDEWKGR